MADAVAKTSTPDAAAGNPIDVTTVTTGAGVVDRQIMGIGDPTANNKAAVSAAGRLSVDASGVAVPVTGTFFQATQPVSAAALPLPAGAATLAGQTQPGVDIGDVTINNAGGASAVNVQDAGNSLTVDAPVGTPVFSRLSDGAAALVGQKTMALSLPVALASDQTALPAVAEIRAATLHVTGTAAVNTALTITLPAAGAGLFHYITSIQWVKLYSVIGVANAAGILITSTNLPGNPIWTTEQVAGGAAGSAGTAGSVVKVIDYQPTTPLKSSVANTATTIVAPLQLQTIWRGNVSYFTGV